MPPPKDSELPDWMRDPEPPERTTLSWEMGQALKRNRAWRKVADAWWRFQGRNRITQRFPKTSAVLVWVLALAVSVGVYMLVMIVLPQLV